MLNSTEAYNALLGSKEQWEQFRSGQSGPIDLRLVDLSGRDLEGRNLTHCDLSGADCENANFDKCRIADTSFNNAYLEGASLVLCEISSCTFDDANMRYIVLRQANIKDCYFHRASLKDARTSHCRFQNCVFDETDLELAEFELTTFRACTFNSIQSKGVSFSSCEFAVSALTNSSLANSQLIASTLKDCSLKDLAFASSTLDATDILTTDIRRLSLDDTQVSRLNVSGSNLAEVDLTQFDLPNTIFMDTAANNCSWPSQKGRVTLSGKYIKSPQLLSHPVQDMKGLPPTLRREIADAQYLETIAHHSVGLASRLSLRIWGATTEFGQSLTRLTSVIVLLILVTSLIYVASDGRLSPWPDNIRPGLTAITDVTLSFIGFGIEDKSSLSNEKQVVLIVARVAGFFILGLWIGIAANKLGKLSSE